MSGVEEPLAEMSPDRPFLKGHAGTVGYQECSDASSGTHSEKTFHDLPQNCPQIERIETHTASRVLQVIFAPLEIAKPVVAQRLFHQFSIPNEITVEIEASVSHSFGTRTDDNGNCAWFRFLCKNIDVRKTAERVSVSYHPEASIVANSSSTTSAEGLPQADHSYIKSGFFLREAPSNGRITLVCFGASPNVRKALMQFMDQDVRHMVVAERLAFFDIVLQGIFKDVDQMAWNLADVFGPMEHKIFADAVSRKNQRTIPSMPFTGLHNIAKHAIYLKESIAAQLLLVDSILATLERRLDQPAEQSASNPTSITTCNIADSRARSHIRENLEYRRSLFRSTQLRVSSLQRRIDSTLTLAFNLVTQQDSMNMMHESNSMKIIAGITMFFLPATAVASILGSQLFDDNKPTPLLNIMWWIVIPLTIIVFILAYVWRRWSEHRLGRGCSYGQV